MKSGTLRNWITALSLPAGVAIWSGWVGLGTMSGFGRVQLLPGLWDAAALNTAITLPFGQEMYAVFALRAWLSPETPEPARRFARVSSFTSLGLGAVGQLSYHLMTAAGWRVAPWPIIVAVSCVPLAVLAQACVLAHLLSQAGEAKAVSGETEAVSGETEWLEAWEAAPEAAPTPLFVVPELVKPEETQVGVDQANREQARRLIKTKTPAEIATELDVATSSVYRWTRDLRQKPTVNGHRV